jgi:hypothetical protein
MLYEIGLDMTNFELAHNIMLELDWQNFLIDGDERFRSEVTAVIEKELDSAEVNKSEE